MAATDGAGAITTRPMPPTVAAEVLARVVAGAAWLAERGAPITGAGIVTAVSVTEGLEVGAIVRAHLIDAGTYVAAPAKAP